MTNRVQRSVDHDEVLLPRQKTREPGSDLDFTWNESCESLSGHIPRSSLRSSDLLPFYHQYPAACCGDFLFISKHCSASDWILNWPPNRRVYSGAMMIVPCILG